MKKSEEELEIKHRDEPNWVTWSTSKHTEDEIRTAYLLTPELICTTYLCRYCTMSEDFIEELIVLSTGIFAHKPMLYTEANRNLVKEIMFVEPTSKRNDAIMQYEKPEESDVSDEFVYYLKASFEHTNIRSKVDWWQIANYQNLSKEFKDKFEVQFSQAKVKSEAEFVN